MEEWRLGQGANMRLLQKIFPVILKGSRYADRLPIGKPEIIQKANLERIKQFYRDWYRPDLMAVVAVGDFDKPAMEQTIKKHFGSIPAATKPRPRQQFDVPDRAETAYAIASDKEAGATVVQLLTLLPSREEKTVGDYRQKTVDNLFASMLTARFSEMIQQPNAPFFNAGAGRGAFFARTKDVAFLSALVKDDGIERGLEALLTEAERVSRFGFTATELERQKQDTLRFYEQYALETENTESASRANEYVRNFLDNEPLPSPADEYAMHKRFLPGITLDEINKLAREWFPDRNRMVIVQAPEKAGVTIPDQTKLAAVLKSAAAKDLKAYVDAASGASLLDSAPTAGSVIRTTAKESIGITELELSNGAKVILKPTTFKEDEILFRATSPGGTSLAADSDYIPASWATQVVTAGGLGKFNVVDLQKMMAGKIASATPFIAEVQEGFNGNSSKKDLELLFQLIYLRFTQPRADATAFNVQATQIKTLLANQSAVPEFNFAKELQATRYQNHPRRQVPTPETINQWNLEKSMAFYRDRFADASDFRFVFVGSFDLPTIKPLIEKYLASLPSIRRKETWKDVGVRTPTDIVVKRVEKGVEPKSMTAIVFSGPFEYNVTNRTAIRAMTEILQRRLLETLREELGGTYSVSAAPSYEKFPNQTYSITVSFGSAPDRTEALIKRVFEEIESFKTNGPTEQQLKDQKETLLREFETSIKLNSYLLNQIASRYDLGEDVAGLWMIPDHYQKIDKATIQQAARTYLNSNRYVAVKLFPEKK
ncbi:MAG TPA: insulinase family protein, partial [Pyrinomonadaceae bacterium]|nr:insulinase family protein [Pyrinomonadaceae bacterium]